MSHTTSSIDCYCGRRAVMRTSWTEDNPGRRFHACLSYNRGGCKFFDWEDPPMCRRSKVIIPGLLKRLNARDAEIEKLQLTNKKLMRWLCAMAVTVALLFLVLIVVWISFATKKNGKKNTNNMEIA
ncbi:hypothetical protein DH2020_000267 [Rehmannia glutinosa]|uniref:GRF-type domain-containing protein n=1 Tax=Rehmannia glutinosa TaxID=99300 RepID=A0ABR0XWE5_REHGL